ncbi:hypothetical protein V9K67_17485 [Paraflavisolibacter sp. H34]|uniref:hypothetical protein n=1 Tax=Huijunlia imazamoxiresistens TaxID=3127457 RepID=UPI0030163327
MGLFDFFKKKKETTPPEAPQEQQPPQRVQPQPVPKETVPKGNVLKTGLQKEEPAKKQTGLAEEEKIRLLDRLFNIPPDQRDEQWQEIVSTHIAEAPFRAGEPKVMLGPDNFPYFVLQLPEAGAPFEKFTITSMKDEFLLEKGFGVVINPRGKGVEWVFTYGDIVNFHLTGKFFSPRPQAASEEKEVIQEDEQILVAQPSESYLPQQARAVLREHLVAHGFNDPQIFLMVRQKPGGEVQELAFNLAQDQFPSREQQAKLMRSLGWFLPRHYSFVSFATNEGLEQNFMPL